MKEIRSKSGVAIYHHSFGYDVVQERGDGYERRAACATLEEAEKIFADILSELFVERFPSFVCICGAHVKDATKGYEYKEALLCPRCYEAARFLELTAKQMWLLRYIDFDKIAAAKKK